MRLRLTCLVITALALGACSSDEPSSNTSTTAVPAASVDATTNETPPTDAPATDVPATDTPSTDTPSTDAPAEDSPSPTGQVGPIDPGMVPASDSLPIAPPYVSPLYDGTANWICRPDIDDVCDEPYPISDIAPDGTVTLEPYAVADDPPVDCFYVYPTISGDQTFNSDLVADNEIGVTRFQAARFNQVCRIYAPVYRSVTLGGLFGSAEGDFATGWSAAYADVLDAWRSYMANDNDGRPVVILSHSQGSFHVTRLLREEIDPDPRQRGVVLSAMIAGTSFQVATGDDVGGDTQNMPLCTAADQFGCVITYQSFRDEDPPRAGALFGRPGDGTDSACVNPAALAGGPGQPDGVFSNGDWVVSDPARRAEITTDLVSLPGLVTTECKVLDGYSYLAVTVNGDPADPRADDIPGDGSPNWGLHTIDINLVQESLVQLVRTQYDAYVAAG